jgi:hypothetical protein
MSTVSGPFDFDEEIDRRAVPALKFGIVTLTW